MTLHDARQEVGPHASREPNGGLGAHTSGLAHGIVSLQYCQRHGTRRFGRLAGSRSTHTSPAAQSESLEHSRTSAFMLLPEQPAPAAHAKQLNAMTTNVVEPRFRATKPTI